MAHYSNKKEGIYFDQNRSHRQSSERNQLTKKNSDQAIGAAIHAISGALAKGDKVTLVDFGTFEVRKRAARKGRNPQTGKEINIAARKVPVFKAGKA